MRKLSVITVAIIVIGLSAHAQTLILSDSYDAGGVVSSNLNVNQGVRQAGTAAPNNLTVSTNAYAHTLTAAGKFNVNAGGLGWVAVDSEAIGPQIGSDSFSIKWRTAQNPAVPDGNWSMFTVLSAVAGNWDSSPMTVNLWSQGFIHLDYGSINHTTAGTNLRMDLSPEQISSAIGATYDPDTVHDFEIRTIAKNANSGTWGFYVDGINVAAGLPYEFEDAAKKMQWNAANATDADWDDLEVSTIALVPPKEYVFFDNFNSTDHDDMGLLYGVRQTNGTVVSSFGPNHALYSITNVNESGTLNGKFTLTPDLKPLIGEFKVEPAVPYFLF